MSKLEPGSIARFVWRVEFIPYVVFTAIGASVLYVLGGIGLDALRHGSLLPPPTKLARFDCVAAAGNFSLYYQHGTDRVQIKSANGLLDGTVRQGRLDWQGFANDRSLLGFAPPSEIAFENAKTLRVNGPDLKDVRCNSVAEAVSQRATSP